MSSSQYSISFLMVCRLIDFALAILELLMFKVCGIITISKIEFFNFSVNERVKGTLFVAEFWSWTKVEMIERKERNHFEPKDIATFLRLNEYPKT